MNHNIHIKDWDISFTANPDEPILQAGLRQDVSMNFDCQSGYCGECKAHLLSGDVTAPLGEHMQSGISDEERAEGFILLCQMHAESDVNLSYSSPSISAANNTQKNASKPKNDIISYPAKVELVQPISPEVIGLSIKMPDTPDFIFQAGQYVEIEFMLDSANETPQKRIYSIASAPHLAVSGKRIIDFHIRHYEGSYFASLLPKIQIGTMVRIYGPSGKFCWRKNHEAKPLLLVASGTGFSPIQSLLDDLSYRAKKQPSLYDATMHLFWGVRSAKEIYAPNKLLSWAAEFPNLTINIIPSSNCENDVLPNHEKIKTWWRKKNYLDKAVSEAHPNLTEMSAYVCGANVMVEACFKSFQDTGFNPKSFYSDPFIVATKAKLVAIKADKKTSFFSKLFSKLFSKS